MTTLPCGCCAPADPGPPAPPANPPGLDELGWRIRRHPDFLAAMTASLGGGALERLTTREAEDPTIALLDAWAAVLDVLTFYTERIANEGFLRTATERRSLAELAAMVGYSLQPAVAAETHLAFELETAAGAPAAVLIPSGTKVQSLPGPDEQPVLFETVEDVDARPEWSALRAEATEPTRPALGATHCHLLDPPPLRPGDALLLTRAGAQGNAADGAGGFALVTVERTEPAGADGAMAVHWTPPLPAGLAGGDVRLGVGGDLEVRRASTARPFGANAPDWRTLPEDVVAAYGGGQPHGDWNRLTMDRVGLPQAVQDPAAKPTKQTLTAATAASSQAASSSQGGLAARTTAPTSPPPHDADLLHLEGDGLDVRVGDPLLLTDGASQQERLFRVTDVTATSLTDFTLTRPVTRVRLSEGREPFTAAVRTTVAHLPGRPLRLAAFPRHEPHAGHRIPLAVPAPPVPEGRLVAATGRRARVEVVASGGVALAVDGDGADVHVPAGARLVVLAPAAHGAAGSPALVWQVQDDDGRRGTVTAVPDALRWVPADPDGPGAAEIATAAAPEDPEVTSATALVLRSALTELVDPATLRLHANVGLATHGESTSEVLGSGDAAVPFQRFVLRDPPLTYRATADGAVSTLVVRVNGTAWQERPTLHGLPGDEHAYEIREVEGGTVVQFGDGRTGARPLSGQENIEAAYRSGGGRAGNVAAGSLSQLRTRPLGVKGVANPLPAEGGADPESGSRARRDAPLRVRTLDRVVSIADYEGFAAAYPGVGAASASWVWDGQRRVVHVTCTGPEGEELAETTRGNVRAAIAKASDGLQPFVVAPHEHLPFLVAARLHLAGDREREAVLAAATAALADRYAAPARPLARSIPASEVIATLHRVPDVRGVDLLDLRATAAGERRVEDVLVAAPARRREDGVLAAAQLLALDLASSEVVA